MIYVELYVIYQLTNTFNSTNFLYGWEKKWFQLIVFWCDELNDNLSFDGGGDRKILKVAL